ncbi:MAG: T9SS type A sorting domain-containing protein, partial [Bacteroidales bacterium]|nr:T9SS type A sorting domain-containing protein [Bacteroidales bacterium]
RVIHTCNVYSPCIRDSINAFGGPYQAGLHYDTIFMGLINRFQNGYNDFILNPYKPGAAYQAYIEYMQQFDSDDHIPLCVSGVPKFLKREGEWINFADDPVYEIWQNIYIAMVPIIMIPQESSQLTEVELEKMCYVFPNPAKDIFKVMSHYTIKDIQVFDMMGKKVLEKDVNYFETEIIVDNFASGTYIVKINTAKGTTEKKLVVQ